MIDVGRPLAYGSHGWSKPTGLLGDEDLIHEAVFQAQRSAPCRTAQRAGVRKRHAETALRAASAEARAQLKLRCAGYRSGAEIWAIASFGADQAEQCARMRKRWRGSRRLCAGK